MQELKEKLEKIQLEVWVLRNLSNILDEHFQATRFKDNVVMDHWSITHLFSEYTTLSYVINNKLNEMEKSLTSLVNGLYEENTINKSNK